MSPTLRGHGGNPTSPTESVRWRFGAKTGDLKKGDEVRKADGSVGIVEAIHTIYKRQTMYNLSVDTAHTYFVGHGQWLVHNCNKIYRGVAVNHPGYEDALKGIAKPRNPSSNRTPESHNAGNTDSSYTSWTRNRETASAFSREDGIILEFETGMPGVTYVWSPDKYYESEVLIQGTVKGAKVTRK
jgi:hypothetical protein